jgi:ubiquinone/menaquinone biosynthesis C-methylase UbiE
MVSLNLDNPELAEYYDAASDSQFANGLRLIELLDLQPGQTVLDIGCGTGRLTRHVAGRLTAGGRITGLDPLATRIEFAHAKNPYPNSEYRVAAGHELAFAPDASVDLVYLNAVFHWIPNQAETLAQIRRVLKPGGRVGLTTGAHELNPRNPLQRLTVSVLGGAPFNIPPEKIPSTGHRVTVTQLIELLLGAALTVDDLRVRRADRNFKTPADVVRHSESSSFGNFLRAVPDDWKNRAREKLQAALAALQTPAGIDLPHHTIFAVARRA